MEQIAKLLFATTLLTIFACVLIFWSTGLAGNGGEYWGYNGQLEPSDAAQNAFSAGDYRFLEVDLTDSNGKRVHVVPMWLRCHDHPPGSELVTRRSAHRLIHGYDSVRLAKNFAEHYNNEMNLLLERYSGVCCGDCVQARGSPGRRFESVTQNATAFGGIGIAEIRRLKLNPMPRSSLGFPFSGT